MKKRILLISYLGINLGLSYADCLDTLLPDFNAGKITIDGNNNKLSLTSPKITKACNVSSSQLEKFVNKNFIKYSADKSIVLSWNYLAINKQPIYDYLKDLKSYDSKYTDSSNYVLYGVANNKFACYQYTTYSNVDGTAHPNYGSFYTCNLPNDQSIDIKTVVSSKDIISYTTKNTAVIKILQKVGVQPSSIKSLEQLYAALNKDDNMQCVLSGELPSQFAITKLNDDGTINIVYSLGANAPHVCQAAAHSDIIMNKVKPLMQINSFITPQDLNK